MHEIIASKNIHSLAKRQTAYLFFGESPSGIFLSVSYALFFVTILAFGFNLSSIIKIFSLALFFLPLTIAAYYYIFLRKQFFLWDNDIISNFISLLLKKSFPESYDEIKKFLLFLASRLDDSYIKYHDPYWYFDAIRNELADVIRYNICPNVNETNKDKILNYFEKISTFLSSYSPEQYEEIKKIISNIKSDFVEIRFADQTRFDKLIQTLSSGFISPAFYVVKNISDILIKTSAYWILALIVTSAIYILTKNLLFAGYVLVFLGSMFVIYNSLVNKPK